MSNKIGAIVLAAGKGKRMNIDKNKVFLSLDGKPIFYHSIKSFANSKRIDQIVVVCASDEQNDIMHHIKDIKANITFAIGGKERQDSVYNGLVKLADDIEFVMVHDSARPYLLASTIHDCADSLIEYGSAVVGVYCIDTIKRVQDQNIVETLDRKHLVNIQTPQCFKKQTLLDAHQNAQSDGFLGTDESMLVARLGEPIKLVVGDYSNIKITTKADLPDKEKKMKIGHGADVHAFTKNRKLILGGVHIPYELGLNGHSDADVLVHAIMDSLLGAASLKDIGNLFPDNDASFKDISSLTLLKKVDAHMKNLGYSVGNIDCTLEMQAPKVSPFIVSMRQNIAACLNVALDQINIKATTTEKLGFVGRCEGIKATCVCLINQD
jgi:2-C-methyl-D-erythritol 4-phosphate cytidylyltransferase / 2-C-methyl-D-erythritol 2,4-cyclodiphosphate synthase